MPFAGCGAKKHPHPITAVKAKAATCGENGIKACYHCEYCLKYFTDADGKKEVRKGELIIPATGNHVPGPDNPYNMEEGKWLHDIRCDVCQVGINLDPITCEKCGAYNLDLNGYTATCRELTCGHVFQIA